MCVIFFAEEKRPSPEMVEKGYNANRHGAGIAWREPDPQTGLTVVRWRKGLDLEEIQAAVAATPLPFIAHFRIPSCGGDTLSLTHPFPVDRRAPCDLEGKTKGFVLFHNGHWNRWKEMVFETALKKGLKIPGGKWSDSRAMAWIASVYGIGALDMLDEKIIAMSPDEIEVCGTGWSTEEGVYVSNTGWKYQTVRTGGAYFTSPPASLPGRGRETTPTTRSLAVGAGKEGASTGEVPFTEASFIAGLLPLSLAEQLVRDKKLAKKALKRIRKAIETKARKIGKKSATSAFGLQGTTSLVKVWPVTASPHVH